jgi:hypothetical protein
MISLLVDLTSRPGDVLKSGYSPTTTNNNKATGLLNLVTGLDMVEQLAMEQADSGQAISKAPAINNLRLKIMPTTHLIIKANTLNKPTDHSELPFIHLLTLGSTEPSKQTLQASFYHKLVKLTPH